MRYLLLALFLSPVASSAYALVVINPSPAGTNYVAPTTSATGLANPDPGWANALSSRSGTYLGNQWVIQTRHQGTPTSVSLDSGTFDVIPNSRIELKNPTGQGLTTTSDIIMYRIDTSTQFSGTPEALATAMGKPLKAITIAGNTPGSNKQVMILSRGTTKNPNNLTHWNVNTSTWAWSETPSGGNFHGYKNAGSGVKAWGTNNVEANSLFDGDDIVKVGADWAIPIGAGSNPSNKRHTFVKAIEFGSSGGNNEAQAANNDSGSGVYFQNGGAWELAGVMHTIFKFKNQPNYSVYGTAGGQQSGNLSLFSDLSQYRDEIESLRNQSNYSFVGDINLDGQISGDGTGSWANDDVTAFIEGWNYQQGAADIISWKKGDLNQDGLTNLSDFILLRDSFNGGAGASLDLSSLLSGSSTAIPEPSAVVLASLALVALGFWAAKRRLACG